MIEWSFDWLTYWLIVWADRSNDWLVAWSNERAIEWMSERSMWNMTVDLWNALSWINVYWKNMLHQWCPVAYMLIRSWQSLIANMVKQLFYIKVTHFNDSLLRYWDNVLNKIRLWFIRLPPDQTPSSQPGNHLSGSKYWYSRGIEIQRSKCLQSPSSQPTDRVPRDWPYP